MFKFLKLVAIIEVLLLGGISYDYADSNIMQRTYHLCPNNMVYTDAEHKVLLSADKDLTCKAFSGTRATYNAIKALSDIENSK